MRTQARGAPLAALPAFALPILAATALPAPARAHAFLASASPAVGSTVAAAPAEISITFTEGVEPAFSRIAVTDPSGARVDRGAPHLEAGDTHLAVSLAALPPGTYTVAWHAVATDTHRTEGTYRFTVAPAPSR